MVYRWTEQDQAAADKGFGILKMQPGWARLSEWLPTSGLERIQKTHETSPLRSPQSVGLKHLVLLAASLLELVSDNETANAFCLVLPWCGRGAYFALEDTRPTNADAVSFDRKIQFRMRRWAKRAHARAKSALGATAFIAPSGPIPQSSIPPIEGSNQKIDQAEMAALPELSATAQRKLKIRWDALLDRHRLTEANIDRYVAAGAETRKLAVSRIPDAQGRSLGGWFRRYNRARQESGISPSLEVAKGRFTDFALEYRPLWESSVSNYETFADQLAALKERVLAEVALVWTSHSEGASIWYQIGCAPAVERAISAVAREELTRVRMVELQRIARTRPPVRSQTNNPILDEVYAHGSDPESIRKLIENGGRNLSPGAQRVVRLVREKLAIVSSGSATASAGSNETASGGKEEPTMRSLAEDAPDREPDLSNTVPDAPATPAVQTSPPQFAPSRQCFGSVAVFTDPRYPPHDVWQEAYVLIKEALKAWGFKGSEPENAFWNRWLEQCNWHDETNFLRASIKHCKVFASHLLGEGRNEDAAVFARVAVGLEKLRAKADARLEDLIAQQVNPEPPVNSTDTQSDKPVESAPEDRLKQFMADHPGTTYADVWYSAKVHKPDFQRWRKNQLKPTSVMSQRIEDVLRGKKPLQKKPRKSSAD